MTNSIPTSHEQLFQAFVIVHLRSISAEGGLGVGEEEKYMAEFRAWANAYCGKNGLPLLTDEDFKYWMYSECGGSFKKP